MIRQAKRRRRSTARGARRSLDWESTLDFDTYAPGVGNGVFLALLAPGDVDTHGGHITVTRVIVDLQIYNTSIGSGAATGGFLAVGVIVQDDDGNGNVDALDLLDADVIEHSWMYYRTNIVGNNLSTANGQVFSEEGLGPSDRHIDITVKRKMNDQQWLMLYAQMGPAVNIADPAVFNAITTARILVQNSS